MRHAQANLITKTDFDTKLQDLNKRITLNKTKHLLVENELKQLKTFDMVYLKDRNLSEGNDGVQNLLGFQLMSKYLKTVNGNITFSEWRSKGKSNEVLKSHNTPAPESSALERNMYLKFNGSCLKTVKKLTYVFIGPMTFNAYIVYSLSSNLNNFDFALENCLFGAIRLVKNVDIDKHKYLGYGTGFDARGTFLFSDGSFPQTVIIFGADLSSSVHTNNKTKDILVLGEGLTRGLDNITLTSEKKYSINFTKSNTKFCLSLHYDQAGSYLFINGTEIHKFKSKTFHMDKSELISSKICLGSILTDFSADNKKKTGLYGNAYDFSIDYKPIAVDDILDIHKHLMEKSNNIK